MTPHPTSPQASRATWFYRQLLKLYPAAFRRRYEGEMLLMFEGEWQRASAGGFVAQCRCGWHLLADFFRTAPREWVEGMPRLAMLTAIMVMLSARYLAVGPLPLLLKVLGCAALTTIFAVAVVAMAGRTRAAQLKLVVLGLPIGVAFGMFLGLNPKVLPPPEAPLAAIADPTLTGSVVYERMRAAYANAKSYVDEGVEQTIYSGFLAHTQTRPFETVFVRGGGFHYEFREQFSRLDDWKKYVIWADGISVKRWWTIQPRVEVTQDLAGALGAAAGVSGTTSTHVPGLLQPELRTGLLAGIRSPIALLGTQRVDGLETFRLQISRNHLPTMTVWIDQQSYLIDRIAYGSSLPDGQSVDSMIVYRPQLNGPVRAAALTFQPGPAPAGWRMFVNGDIDAMIIAGLASLLAVLLNVTHRRVLRKRWWGAEAWSFPLRRRQGVENIAIGTVSFGMWLGGSAVGDTLQNLLLALFMLQGGFMLYVIHRRSRGFARFAVARGTA